MQNKKTKFNLKANEICNKCNYRSLAFNTYRFGAMLASGEVITFEIPDLLKVQTIGISRALEEAFDCDIINVEVMEGGDDEE